VLASGSTTALGTGSWHRLGLSFNDATITASVDGKAVKTFTDSSYHSGQLGIGTTDYDIDQFDNILILPVKVTKSATANQ
jgi:hypothetical protein